MAAGKCEEQAEWVRLRPGAAKKVPAWIKVPPIFSAAGERGYGPRVGQSLVGSRSCAAPRQHHARAKDFGPWMRARRADCRASFLISHAGAANRWIAPSRLSEIQDRP